VTSIILILVIVLIVVLILVVIALIAYFIYNRRFKGKYRPAEAERTPIPVPLKQMLSPDGREILL
jgi:flagellar basal body-associated protein FliL